MSHPCHRSISSAIINPNSLEQGSLRDFNSGFSSDSSGVKGTPKFKNKVGDQHRTQNMSDSISTFSEPGIPPEILQARVSGDANPEFWGSFVTTKADIPSLSIAIPQGEGVWNPQPGSHRTKVTVPSLLWDTPRYNQEFGIIQQGKNSAKFLELYEKSDVFSREFGVIE